MPRTRLSPEERTERRREAALKGAATVASGPKWRSARRRA